jgi:hypothetical protein
MEIISEILSINFSDYNELFTINFTTQNDGDEFFRSQEIDADTLAYYYPEVFNLKKWEDELDNDNTIYMLEQFYEDGREFPPQQLL